MRLNNFIVFVLLIISLFSIFVYADSNGIWHNSENIKGGTFGSDEQAISNYTFKDIVKFNSNVYWNNDVKYKNQELDLRYPVLNLLHEVPVEKLPFP